MKSRILISVFALLIVISSCHVNKNEDINIFGKWYGYNISETEYCEYDIDKESIGALSHYYGTVGLKKYRIIKDTLFYLEGEFTLKVISENQFTMTIRGETDTLTRLPDSVITFHTIDYHNDSIFNSFYEQFERRAYDSWIKYGYLTEKELEESIIKKGEIKEEIILINQK